jgi:hypothetical protein
MNLATPQMCTPSSTIYVVDLGDARGRRGSVG